MAAVSVHCRQVSGSGALCAHPEVTVVCQGHPVPFALLLANRERPLSVCCGVGEETGILFFFFINFIYLFIIIINFWLCWVFVSARGLPLAAASGGHSSSRCTGLSLSWPLLLRSPGSRRAGSVVVAHGPSRSAAHGILPDQGSNPCPLHWQADSQPLRHQGSPLEYF